MIILLDFTQSWNDAWVANGEEDDRWLYGLLALTVTAFLGVLGISGAVSAGCVSSQHDPWFVCCSSSRSCRNEAAARRMRPGTCYSCPLCMRAERTADVSIHSMHTVVPYLHQQTRVMAMSCMACATNVWSWPLSAV